MSHLRFKNKRAAKDERELRRLAATIPDEAVLTRILDACKPGTRAAVLERIRPYLSFQVSESVA